MIPLTFSVILLPQTLLILCKHPHRHIQGFHISLSGQSECRQANPGHNHISALLQQLHAMGRQHDLAGSPERTKLSGSWPEGRVKRKILSCVQDTLQRQTTEELPRVTISPVYVCHSMLSLALLLLHIYHCCVC